MRKIHVRGHPVRVRPLRWTCGLALLLAGAGAAACGEREAEPELADEQAVSVEALGRLGGEIYNEPERAEEILEDAGLTPEEFEERVRRITNDPVLAREYSRGFEVIARAPAPEAPDSLQAADTTGAAPEAGAGG